MYTIRNIVVLSASLLFTAVMFPALAAPLPVGTVLTIDPGINNATSPICYTGSCYRLNFPSQPGHVYDFNFVPGSDGGIVIGKNQASGVSPASGELAGFVRVDAVEAPGSMYTTPYQFDPTDASVNIFDDASCLTASTCAGKTVLGTWNRSGGIGRGINFGTASNQCTSTFYCPGVTRWAITPAGGPGLDGDRYTLEYERRIPDFLDGFDQVYTFHLEGTIQLPKVVGVDVAVRLAAAPNPAIQNATLTYTATISNFGTQTATGVNLSDTLPIGASFVSAVASQGSCNGTAVVYCALGDLASGVSATVQINVIPIVTGTLNSSVSVTSLDVDVNPANNSVSSSVAINAPADVGVTMTGRPNPVKRLKNLTYTITVNNSGLADASGVTVTDTLPSSMRFVSATASQGSCSGTTTVTCSLGSMTNGASASVQIVVQPRNVGIYNNTVRVSSGAIDNNSANNRANVIIIVR